MASTYRGNFRGIGRMLQRPGMQRAVIAAATALQPLAESLSPTGTFPDDPHPGQYRASFRIEYGVKNVRFRGQPHERPYGRLINTSSHAQIVEHGNGRTPRYAVLRRTIDMAKAARSGG